MLDLCISFNVFVFLDELIEEVKNKVITERMINSIYQDLGPVWKNLARELDIDHATYTNIDIDEDKVEEKAMSLCMGWFHRKGSKATVGRLVAALVNIDKQIIVDKLLAEVIFKSDIFLDEAISSNYLLTSPLLSSPLLCYLLPSPLLLSSPLLSRNGEFPYMTASRCFLRLTEVGITETCRDS